MSSFHCTYPTPDRQRLDARPDSLARFRALIRTFDGTGERAMRAAFGLVRDAGTFVGPDQLDADDNAIISEWIARHPDNLKSAQDAGVNLSPWA